LIVKVNHRQIGETDTMSIEELKKNELSLTIPEEDIISFRSYADSPDIIGQPRAIRALKMGTEIRGKGYNILVTGISGTGRKSAIKKILSSYKPDEGGAPPEDILYVYNFREPDAPMVLYLPQGQSYHFKQAIHDLVEELKSYIRNRLSSDAFKKRRDELVKLVEDQENHRITELEQLLAKEGFRIVRIQEEDQETTDIKPLYKGELSSFEELQALTLTGELGEEEWHNWRERYYHHMDELKGIFEELRDARFALDNELEALKKELLEPGIDEAVEKVRKAFPAAEIGTYLTMLRKDVAEHLFLFLKPRDEEEEGGTPALIRYGVNVLVDNKHTKTVPVIFENHPTYSNLFGTIESRFDLGGEGGTTFMMIKAGSLIRARGGFIVLNAKDILQEDGVWEHLKRALQTGEVEIQGPEGTISFQNQVMKPQPISIDTKVIMTGDESLYDVLYSRDPDFAKHFKISAEFDSVMERTAENCGRYIGFTDMICREEKLLPADNSGIGEIIRYGIILSEQRDRLSTRFSMIADLLREADYWAKKEGLSATGRDSVRRALREREFLWNLPEEKMSEMIVSGEMLLSLGGSAVGRANGLAVHDRGYYSFGMPVVISARVAPGNEGIVNVEREVGLSGEIHDKWMYIIEGFLRHNFARDFPLSIYASICFEQSYGEIDGDSASSSEMYTLLSAIGEIPLRQDVAVTGSINQLGQLQPVGGISEKVEGFFKICSRMGLSGSQGIIMPAINKNNLVLSDVVTEAVEEGTFHIWAIDTVFDGMEILSGFGRGERNKKGIFPAESVSGKVERRLKEMADLVKNYSS
jgi:predicted ATP-dependent protease